RQKDNASGLGLTKPVMKGTVMFSAKSALLGFAMGFATITAANANAVISWDPQAVGLGTAAIDGPFSFDNITTADYTDIHVTSATASTLSYVETGLLNLSAFSLNGGSPTPVL